jgi:hypothetical protein
VKVRVPLGDGPVAGETLWAEFLGEQRYRLANCPFHAEGLAEGDIVRCAARDGWLTVLAVDEGSGNGTIRILFARDADTASVDAVLRELTSVGCAFERASPTWVAVTVPATMAVPFSQLSNYLNETDDRVVEGWEVGKWPQGTQAASGPA